MRTWLAVLLAFAALCAAHRANAHPQARLVYGRGAGAETCADEAALRRAVAVRIGYDPFFPWAPKTVVATIAARGDRLIAHVELVGEDAHSEGGRDLDVEGHDCTSLFDTLALTISIAIDPHALARPAARDEPEAPAAPPASERAAVAPPPAPEPAREVPVDIDRGSTRDATRVPVQVSTHLRAAFGTQPSVAPGLAVGAALAWTAASVGVEAAADLPSASDVPSGGRVQGWLATGSVVPCLHAGPVRACAVGTLGRFEGSARGVSSPATRAVPFVAVGTRAGLHVPLSPRFAVGAHADLLLNANPATLEVGDAPVWRASRLAGALALGAVEVF